jgi:hypothetical protein
MTTADLDRLELELRCQPGIVAVGLDRGAGEELFIQAAVLSSIAPVDFRDQIRRIVDANVPGGVRLEIVVDRLDAASTPAQ